MNILKQLFTSGSVNIVEYIYIYIYIDIDIDIDIDIYRYI